MAKGRGLSAQSFDVTVVHDIERLPSGSERVHHEGAQPTAVAAFLSHTDAHRRAATGRAPVLA